MFKTQISTSVLALIPKVVGQFGPNVVYVSYIQGVNIYICKFEKDLSNISGTSPIYPYSRRYLCYICLYRQLKRLYYSAIYI